ncbi:hypothetical protein QZH41_013497, partial [Actinostola sp. cb2023]
TRRRGIRGSVKASVILDPGASIRRGGGKGSCLVASFLVCKASSDTVWPIPVQTSLSGKPFPVSRALSIKTSSKSNILEHGVTRYLKYITTPVLIAEPKELRDGEMLELVVVNVDSDNEALGLDTSYKYTINFNSTNTLTISAESPFGALRRFIPLELLYNILDGMSFVKMNVLHFHFSDLCRFSVESNRYPDLRNNEQQIYTQDDIKTLVAYARDRGIRVVPEVESANGHPSRMDTPTPLGMDTLQERHPYPSRNGHRSRMDTPTALGKDAALGWTPLPL